jgi:D-alanyl-D-alanine dipeptidase
MRPIPRISAPSSDVPHDFINEKFVELTTDDRFEVAMQYPLLGMRAATSRCFVREGTYERLLVAAGKLPGGWRFKIFDAWRPFALQKELYELYSVGIIKKFGLSGQPIDRQREVIRQYVAEPNENVAMPPAHTTGGAVDLTLSDENGGELEMGTGFDSFRPEAATAALEEEGPSAARDNRRLLYEVMTSAGFTNLPSEWWHYDFGDDNWAYYSGSPARYAGVFTIGEIDAE